MNITTFLQAILQGFKSGLITSLGQPLLTFLADVKGVDPLSPEGVLVYVSQLDLLRSNAIASLVQTGGETLQKDILELNTLLSNEIQSAIQAAQKK